MQDALLRITESAFLGRKPPPKGEGSQNLALPLWGGLDGGVGQGSNVPDSCEFSCRTRCRSIPPSILIRNADPRFFDGLTAHRPELPGIVTASSGVWTVPALRFTLG